MNELANQFNITSLALYEKLESKLLWADNHDSFILSRDIAFSPKQIIITTYDGILSLEGVTCQQYLTMHSQFLQALVPIASIQQEVNSFISTYFGNKVMIGVHFRAHDNIQDWVCSLY